MYRRDTLPATNIHLMKSIRLHEISGSPPSTAIVIGSGIVGAATAYYLGKRGVAVHLLEATAPAAEASGAADGAVSVASKRPGTMMTAALRGVALYRDLARDGLFADLYKTRSTFIIAASQAECELLEKHREALLDAGVKAVALSRQALQKRFQVLSPNALMGVEVHDEGHAIGYEIVHRLVKASGAFVHRDTPVREFVEAGGRVAGVVTPKGVMTADAMVIAAGGGSANLLNLDNVLIPRKGQLLVTERAPALNRAMPGAIMSGRYLLSKGSQKGTGALPSRGLGLVIDPLRTGQFLIGGTREDFGDRQTNDIDAVRRILLAAVDLVPGLAGVRLLRSFAGVRTAVIDGLPLIGRLPGRENAYVATGFEGDGICLGPLTGKTIAQMICGETPEFDLSDFDPARFMAGKVAA